MTITSAQILAYYRGTKSNLPGECLHTMWLACGQPPASAATYPSAKAAYALTTRRHTDMNPPAGAPIFFDSPEGDVVCSTGSGGVLASDVGAMGSIGATSIAGRLAMIQSAHPGYAVKYLGWTEDIFGQDIDGVYTVPDTTEDDMPLTNADADLVWHRLAANPDVLEAIALAVLQHAINDNSDPKSASLANLYSRINQLDSSTASTVNAARDSVNAHTTTSTSGISPASIASETAAALKGATFNVDATALASSIASHIQITTK